MSDNCAPLIKRRDEIFEQIEDAKQLILKLRIEKRQLEERLRIECQHTWEVVPMSGSPYDHCQWVCPLCGLYR